MKSEPSRNRAPSACPRDIRLLTALSIVLLLTLGTTLSHVSKTFAGEFSWSGPGILLLTNGNVIQGRQVIPRGTSVTVMIDETAQIQIPSERIVHIGRDVRELYMHQVQQTKEWESGDHFQMAKWCLRNGLVDEAYTHYLELRKLSGKHSKFKQYETELRDALLHDPTMKEALKATLPTTETPYVRDANKVTRTDDSVNANKEVSNHGLNPQLNFVLQSPVHQDYFRRQIQPFLAMRCGQAGCHGTLGKTNFHAVKSGSFRGRPASDVSLESVLRFMTASKVEDSELWIRATTRHGNQTSVGLKPENATERELMERLRRWHQSVYTPPPPVIQTAAVQDAYAPQAMVQPATVKVLNASNPQGESAASNHPPKIPEIGDDLAMLEREIAKLEEIEKARKSIRNRHDPEEFHRLHLNPLRPPSPTQAPSP